MHLELGSTYIDVMRGEKVLGTQKFWGHNTNFRIPYFPRGEIGPIFNSETGIMSPIISRVRLLQNELHRYRENDFFRLAVLDEGLVLPLFNGGDGGLVEFLV